MRSGSLGHRAGAGRDVDAEPDGVGGHDDVAVQHGGVDAVAAHRLQRDLGGQLGLLDGVEDRALAADAPGTRAGCGPAWRMNHTGVWRAGAARRRGQERAVAKSCVGRYRPSCSGGRYLGR